MKTPLCLLSLLWLCSYFPCSAQYQLDAESQQLFESQVQHVQHLSYAPTDLQNFLHEHSYERWQFYFIKPGQLEQATQIALAVQELMVERNAIFSYQLYQSKEQHAPPFFLAISSARNLEDYNRQLAGLDRELGPRFVTLYNQLLALCDRVKWDHRSKPIRSPLHPVAKF